MTAVTTTSREVNINAAFLTAGKATFTVEPAAAFVTARQCNAHYTFRITTKDSNRGGGKVSFVSMLTGPDNESDYTYLGLLTDTGIRLTAKSAYGPDTVPVLVASRVVAALQRGDADKIAAAGWKVCHEGRCGRCNRLLTVPESVSFGIGPECRKKM